MTKSYLFKTALHAVGDMERPVLGFATFLHGQANFDCFSLPFVVDFLMAF